MVWFHSRHTGAQLTPHNFCVTFDGNEKTAPLSIGLYNYIEAATHFFLMSSLVSET